jgi:hypothetical protein
VKDYSPKTNENSPEALQEERKDLEQVVVESLQESATNESHSQTNTPQVHPQSLPVQSNKSRFIAPCVEALDLRPPIAEAATPKPGAARKENDRTRDEKKAVPAQSMPAQFGGKPFEFTLPDELLKPPPYPTPKETWKTWNKVPD